MTRSHRIAIIVVSFAFGAIAGRFARISPTVQQPESNPSQEAKERALGKLYTRELGLIALADMRVLTMLESNHIATAKRLLVLDLGRRLSSLSALSSEVELSEFDEKVLRDGNRFLQMRQGEE